MGRLFLLFNFVFITFFCFAQQNMPGRIIGNIPGNNSTGTFQIQLGAFSNNENAENVFLRLQRNALIPVKERFNDLTRVMIRGIPANQVVNFLAIIKQAGFNEVIIRPDHPIRTSENTISEKWEISSPDAAFSSFEFNHDRHYIVVENDRGGSVHFGEYGMPQTGMINLENLGTIVVNSNDDRGVDFSFFSIDEPDMEMQFNALRAEAIPESPELDLFARSWVVIDSTEKESIGIIFLFTSAGTYFVTYPGDRSGQISEWRWYDSERNEFEYSHDDWGRYGRAEIRELTRDSLILFDPGFYNIIPGYSRANMNNLNVLVPYSD